MAVADRLPFPDLNPAEGVWTHLKNSLGNPAPCSIDDWPGWSAPASNACSTGKTCSTASLPKLS